MSELTEWDSFHVIVGSAAGALIGLQFVVMTLIAASVSELYKHVAISANSFANMVAFAMSQPDDVDVNEILFRPTRQELRDGSSAAILLQAGFALRRLPTRAGRSSPAIHNAKSCPSPSGTGE
jgi:hypothetical protein